MCGAQRIEYLSCTERVELAEARAVERHDLLGVVGELRAGQQRADARRAVDHPRVRLGLEQERVEVARGCPSAPARPSPCTARPRTPARARRCTASTANALMNDVPLVRARPSLASSSSGSRPSSASTSSGLAHVALVEHLGLADQRAADVGERHEVAGRAARAALGDQRQDVVVEQVQQPLDQLQPHAGVALGQAVGPEEHRRPGHLRRGDLAGAGAEEAQHVLLQGGGLGGRDLPVRAVAEAGRDPVDRDLAGDQVALELARGARSGAPRPARASPARRGARGARRQRSSVIRRRGPGGPRCPA